MRKLLLAAGLSLLLGAAAQAGTVHILMENVPDTRAQWETLAPAWDRLRVGLGLALGLAS